MPDDAPPVVDAELVEEETSIVTIAPAEVMEAVERGTLDAMMTFAKRYPRPPAKVIRQQMESYATIDDETAASCFYTLKRKDKSGATKLIQGPSVRMSEIVTVCYKNLRAGSRIIGCDDRKITSQGFCFDCENNVGIQVEESRSIVGKNGRRFSDDMVVMAGRAINAISRRNAVFEIVPRALFWPVYETAKHVAVGDVKSLAVQRDKVLARLVQMGLSNDDVLRVLEKQSLEEIDVESLEQLIGLGTSLREGLLTVEEVVAEPAPEQGPRLKLTDRLRAARAKKK